MTADALVQLRDALVNAFPDPPEAGELAERAGFAEGSLPIDQHDMRGWWWAALHEAWRQGILVALVERAIADEVIGPELKQPFVELLAPITQVQARPAPRPHGLRVLITAGASLLIIAALALGAVWLNAPDEMTDLTRPFNIAVAEFGHLTPEGQTVSSDVERRMSRLIFEAFRDGGEDPPLVWHDSLPWWQKRTPLDVVTGATWEERQGEARALAYRVGANLVIYGGEMEGGNDRWMGVRFYARELAEGEELIGEYQLGEPIRLLQADIAQPGLEEEMIARARIYYLFANALNQEAYRRYAAARADLEAAAAVPGWEDRQGIEVLYYYIGRELLEGKEYDEALAAFDRAIVENEDYARPYLGRGEVYRRRAEPLPAGQADEKLALLDLAAVEYERAIGIASESPGSGIEVKARLDLAATHQLKAGIRSEQGQLQQAMDELDQAGEQAGMARCRLAT
jgi:tetratricopeptide (TPR) repeat protein